MSKVRCGICGKEYSRIMRHILDQHPDEYQRQVELAIKLFNSGMTLREIAADDSNLWSFGTGLTKAIHFAFTPEELKEIKRKRISITGKGKPKPRKIKGPIPFDADNSSNPWLIMNKSRTPILHPSGNKLTPEFIWSQKREDRNKLVEWVFNYYRKCGYPIFSLSDDRLKSDFEKLKKKRGNIIFENGVVKNSNSAGLGIAKHFTFELFIRAKGDPGTKSCMEIFEDDEKFRSVLRNRMGYKSSKEGGVERPYVFEISDEQITQGMRSSGLAYSVSHFKPMIAKFIYERYGVKSVLDYSAGWGARAIAALSCGINYYAIDPLTSEKVNEMIKYFGGVGQCINGASEKIDYSIFPSVDMAFSSPPYFDLEVYDGNDTRQSSNYKNYCDWLEVYWRPTVKKCIERSKYFSFVAVERVRKFDLLEDMKKICEEQGLVLKESLPIKTSTSHLSKKSKTGRTNKKTEHILVFEKKKFTYNSKYCVMSMAGNKEILGNYQGFKKNKNNAVSFDLDFCPDFDKVSYQYIYNKPSGSSSRLIQLISRFDEEFFALSGKKYREIRETKNQYDKIVAQRDYCCNDVIGLINEWDQISGEKYGWHRHSGKDKQFFLKFYETEKNNLFCRFYYIKDKMLGYSVLHRTEDCYEYLIRKTNVSLGRNTSLYVDYKTFEEIWGIEQRPFFVNWGASKGSLLRYKKKFGVFSETPAYFYMLKRQNK